MQLLRDPETGDFYPRQEEVNHWRILLCQPAGEKGRPRVLREGDGPLPVPREATEEDVLRLLDEMQIDAGEMRVVARAMTGDFKPMFDREVDMPEEAPAAGMLQPDNVLQEAVQALTAGMVQMQAATATLVDRRASSNERLADALAGGSRADEEEKPSILDKLFGLLDDDDVTQLKEELKSRATKKPPEEGKQKKEEE